MYSFYCLFDVLSIYLKKKPVLVIIHSPVIYLNACRFENESRVAAHNHLSFICLHSESLHVQDTPAGQEGCVAQLDE